MSGEFIGHRIESVSFLSLNVIAIKVSLKNLFITIEISQGSFFLNRVGTNRKVHNWPKC